MDDVWIIQEWMNELMNKNKNKHMNEQWPINI
jgi:hypothetical protein